MALATKVGSISCPAGTGNLAITGVGFQPKAVLFWGNKRTSDGSTTTVGISSTQYSTLLGMTDGAAGAALCDNDDFGGGDAFLDIATTGICFASQLYGVALTNYVRALIVSLDANGFTLNFTSVTSGVIINYIALGGADLTNAKIITGTIPSTTGSLALTGAGFKPDCCILLAGLANSAQNVGTGQSIGGMGFTDGTHHWASSSGFAGTLTTYARSDRCLVIATGGTAPNTVDATLTSLDADGLTINISIQPVSGTIPIRALCLKGGKFFVGNDTQKTASTGTKATTGVGFQPTGVFFQSPNKVAGTTVVTTLLGRGAGATDGASQSSLSVADGPSNLCESMDRTHCLTMCQESGTTPVAAQAAVSTLDADGFTLNWTTVIDSTARQFGFLAFGSSAAAAAASRPKQRRSGFAAVQGMSRR